MKLLIITNIPTPYRLDFFNVLYEKGLESDVELTVFYCSASEPNRHWEVPLDRQKFANKILPGVHLNLKDLFLHFNPDIIAETRKVNPDVILYAGSWNMPTLLLNLFWGKMFNKKAKAIFWSEGHEGAVLHRRGIIAAFRKFVHNEFDAFAVPNSRSKNYLFNHVKANDKPVILLPNTVDGAFYTKTAEWSEEKASEVKQKYGIGVDRRICIQVAQIDVRKSPVELVHYWESLTEGQKGKYVLVLVGEGDLRTALNEYISEKGLTDIFILGQLEKHEVRDLLLAASFFILLTKNDPNPLTLIEASFAGLPILTTQFAGNCGELVHEQNGVVVRNIAVEEFHNAFLKIKSLAVTTEAGKYSAQNAQNHFNIEAVAESFLQQLKNVLIER